MLTRRASYVAACLIILFAIGGQAQNTDPNNDTGLHSYETYDGARENANLGTGNLFVSVPLLTLPGRNGGLQSHYGIWNVPTAVRFLDELPKYTVYVPETIVHA